MVAVTLLLSKSLAKTILHSDAYIDTASCVAIEVSFYTSALKEPVEIHRHL